MRHAEVSGTAGQWIRDAPAASAARGIRGTGEEDEEI
jgi:hypothetical protein